MSKKEKLQEQMIKIIGEYVGKNLYYDKYVYEALDMVIKALVEVYTDGLNQLEKERS